MRAAYRDVPIVSRIVRTAGIGRFGSSALISRRTAAATDSGGTEARTYSVMPVSWFCATGM